MENVETKKEALSTYATQRVRDKNGHFVKVDMQQTTNGNATNGISDFLKNNTKVSNGHRDDKLIDLEVGNPLQRITELLEDIKKQKAFSFTLKGSLGVTGVVLSLSLLGLFGTQHVLCDKGVQSQLGTVKILRTTNEDSDSVMNTLHEMKVYYTRLFNPNYIDAQPQQRVVLITPENKLISVEADKKVQVENWNTQAAIVTGNYDSCTQTIKPTVPNAIESVL